MPEVLASSAVRSTPFDTVLSSLQLPKNLPNKTLETVVQPRILRVAGVEIQVFPHEEAVNHQVASYLISALSKGSTERIVLSLAADSTHSFDANANAGAGRFGNIYNKVDLFFRSNPECLNQHVILTNLDEIDPLSVVNRSLKLSENGSVESFAKIISADLDFVTRKVGKRWQPLNPDCPAAYDNLMLGKVGIVRQGFFGLGQHFAHLGYLGERANLFAGVTRIELGEEEALRRNATHAFSLGTDHMAKFDLINITVKGERKAQSLLDGIQDAIHNKRAKTGLGWVIQNRNKMANNQQIRIVADVAAVLPVFQYLKRL